MTTGRAHARRRAGRAVALLLAIGLALAAPPPRPAAAQEGPVVVGETKRPSRFQFYDWRFEAETIYRRRDDRRKFTDAGEFRFTEDRFEETLTIENKGHIYHPNLVDLTNSLTIGLRQNFTDDGVQSEQQLGYIDEYDFNAEILRKEVAPVTLYTRRTQDVVNREFGPSLDNTIMSTGAVVDYRSQKIPTRIEIFHSDQEQSGFTDDNSQGLDEGFAGDFSISQNTLLWHSEYRPRDGHVVTWDYTLSDVSEKTEGLADNDYILNDANLSYSIDFGQSDQHNLTSALSYFDQTGDFPISRLRLAEILRLRHSDAFETRYQYLYDLQSFDDLDQSRHRGTSGFTHRLYKSLVTNGNIGVETIDRSDDSNSLEFFADIGFDYRKIVPLGTFSAFLSLAYDWQENDAQVSPTPFVDVPRTFSDPAPIILVGNGIDPSTIQITDPSGLIIYRPGIDYEARGFPDRVEIDRIVGGLIGNGSSVLIDYVLQPQAQNTTTTNYFSIGGRYDLEKTFLAGTSIYARFARQDQDIDTDNPAAFTPNTFTDIIYGIEYRNRGLTLGAEVQTHDAEISPFDATRYFVRLTHPLHRTLTLSLNSAYTQLDFTDIDNHVDLFTASLGLQYRPTRQLTISAIVVYRDEQDDLRGPTRGLEEQININWRYRQTSVYAVLRNSDLETDFQDTSFQYLEIGIRREF